MESRPNIEELQAAFSDFNALSGELTTAYRTLERRVAGLKAELAEKRRLAAVGEVAARLAHQIRTPLSSAMLDLSQLADGVAEPERAGRLAKRSLTSLKQIEDMIRDMLGFVREQAAVDTKFRLTELLDAFAGTLAPQLAEPDQLVIHRACPDFWLYGRRDALVGALLNLAVNALQAGGTDTRLQLSIHADGTEQLILAFSDDGPGVAVEVRNRIFEPFFTTRPGGTGLGLPFVRSTFEAHGGTVSYLAEPVGSTFVLRLPVHGGNHQ